MADFATFSIVIPTFNEVTRIGRQVGRCSSLCPRPEVIVADGGSTDGTRSRAEGAGARVVTSARRGRASQMNLGATASQGDVLIFLHADVVLSQQAYCALGRAVADPDLIGGAFRRRFDSTSRIVALGCRLA